MAIEHPVRAQMTRVNNVLVVVIKGLHTAIWAAVESCVLYVLVAGLLGRTDKRVGLAGAVVATETTIFAVNGWRCPLSQVAVALGADRGGVTDLYLPSSVTRNLPLIHVPIIVVATCLHIRNVRARSGRPRMTGDRGPWSLDSRRDGTEAAN